jgi:predicted nucleic acid-binding protein
MSIVFADTSFFVALASERDEYHAQAIEFAARQQDSLLTTDFVLVELGNHFSRVGDRESFLALLPDLQNSKDEVIPASRALIAGAIHLYSQRSDKSWSLTDCISFNVMREHGITDALTTDHHFEQAGFTIQLRR